MWFRRIEAFSRNTLAWSTGEAKKGMLKREMPYNPLAEKGKRGGRIKRTFVNVFVSLRSWKRFFKRTD